MKKVILLILVTIGFAKQNYSQVKTFPDTIITCSQSIQLGLVTPTTLEIKGSNWPTTVNLSIYDVSTSINVFLLGTIDFSKYPDNVYTTTLYLKSGNYIAKYDDWRPDLNYLKVIPQNGTSSSNMGGSFFVDNPINISTSTFSWSPNIFIDDTTKHNPIVNPNQTTEYVLKVEQADNTVTYDTVKISVNPLKISAGIDKTTNCWDTISLSSENISIYIKSPEVTWFIYNINTSKMVLTGNGNINSNFFFQHGEYKLKIINNGPSTFDYNVKPLIGFGTGLNTNISIGDGDSIFSYFSVSDIGLQLKWSPADNLTSDTGYITKALSRVTTNYYLTGTTSNGCISKDTVKIAVDPLTLTSPDKSLICGGKVQFDNPITNYTGSGSLTYDWTPGIGLDSAMIAQPTVEITSDTNFILTVSTLNGCTAVDTVRVTVAPFIATVNNITVSCGNTANLDVSTNYTGSGILTYNWNPSTGLSATNIVNPVATLINNTNYSVVVNTPNGCSSSADVELYTSIIDFNPSICMVTVNDSDKNVIVWQRTARTAIDSFYIYRESSQQTDKYDLIGKLPYSAQGIFTDTASNASVQSNKYKIATKDICGYLTEMSAEHKTMHLTINKGIGTKWNLIWEQYVGQSVSSYKLYRGTSKSNLIEIGSTSGSNTTYTDETAPEGILYYVIEVVLPQACTNLKSTNYASSRSNIISTSDAVTGIQNSSINELFIYPNPVIDKLYIKNIKSSNVTLSFFDLQGKIIMTQKIKSGQVDISYLSKGIYIVKLIDNGNVIINKLIKE